MYANVWPANKSQVTWTRTLMGWMVSDLLYHDNSDLMILMVPESVYVGIEF